MQQMAEHPTVTLYGLHLRYPTALFPELKQLAAPATLDTPPLDLGVEDHHTAAPLSVGKTDTALGMLEDLLAIELMLAHDMRRRQPSMFSAPAQTPHFAWSRKRSQWRTRSPMQSIGPFGTASQSSRRVRP
jgi:histidine ammonia-lyase